MRLEELRLFECSATMQQYQPLANLTALKRLSLARCRMLPASGCLGQLPALGLVSIRASPSPDYIFGDQPPLPHGVRAEMLDLALSTFNATQLTQLQLAELATEWPPALLRLRGLQVLCLESRRQLSGAGPLPGGPWLSSLRWAALYTSVAATALPDLATATQLEGLAVYSSDSLDTLRSLLLDILAWAPQQRALRLLEIRTSTGRPKPDEPDPAVRAAIEQAQQAVPDLQVQFGRRLQKRLLFDNHPQSIELGA